MCGKSAVILGYVGKPSSRAQTKIALDKRYLDHAAEILGRLLESREDPPAFLQPADQALHDASPAVDILVALHRESRAVLLLLRRDHRLDPQPDQVLVDPVGPIPLVAGQGDGPRD